MKNTYNSMAKTWYIVFINPSVDMHKDLYVGEDLPARRHSPEENHMHSLWVLSIHPRD